MAEDDELEELRKQRQEELEEQAERQEDQVEQQRQQFKELAKEYLTDDARDRLNNLRVAKPELASTVEMQIVQLGRAGRINEMRDDELKNILKDIQNSGEDTDIKFRR